MFFIFNILILIFIAFLAGLYCAQQTRYSNNWFQGLYVPLIVLIVICWMFEAPWFWVIIQGVFQAIAFLGGMRYQSNHLAITDVDHIEQIPDLQLTKNLPAHLKDDQMAIVLMNMGGPLNIAGVGPFLKRLFNDPAIFRFPFAQSFFADLLIRSRLKEVQGRYKLMGGRSPILSSSLKQMEALSEELKKRGRNIEIFLSFNYSDPLPLETIGKIKKSGKKFIFLLSLYPHFSFSTTASNIFYLKEAAKVNYPEVQFLESFSYHLYEGYILAFVKRIQETLKPNETLEDFYLLFSAHGTPLYFLEEGDPYSFLVSQTISQILASLKRKHNWSISYQSAVGPLMWLKPSTGAMLQALARKGVKKIIVVPISFVTDHIETLCEIDIEYRHLAQEKGISNFRMTKALECHPDFIGALADCVENSLKPSNP